MEENQKREAHIEIHFMGNLSCLYNGEPVAFAQKTTVKSTQLFLLLLLNAEKGLPRNLAKELLYRDSDADFASSYKTLVSRLRRSLHELTGLKGEECIVSKSSVLRLGEVFTLTSDVLLFEKAHERAARIGEGEERIRALEEAILAYGGELLPTLASDPWVLYRNEALKRAFSEDVRKLCEYYRSVGDYREEYEHYHRAEAFFPYEEEWVIGCINALSRRGNRAQALREYERMRLRLSTELGVSPSEHLNRALMQLNEKSVVVSDTAQTLQEIMSEDDDKKGTYVCDYPFFLEHLKLLRRISRRTEVETTLFQITLLGKNENASDEEELREGMAILRRALCSSLRASDLLTRYSTNCFLLLLWGAGQENAANAIERVNARIRAEDDKGLCRVRIDRIDQGEVGISAP